jgi:hypothetical protein
MRAFPPRKAICRAEVLTARVLGCFSSESTAEGGSKVALDLARVQAIAERRESLRIEGINRDIRRSIVRRNFSD